MCGAGERKLLDEFLLARALEHDAPGVLLRLACDWLRAESIVRRPVDSLTRRVVTARDAAQAETYHRLGPLLQPPRPMQLDGLLDVDPDLGITRLAWLRRGATVATEPGGEVGGDLPDRAAVSRPRPSRGSRVTLSPA